MLGRDPRTGAPAKPPNRRHTFCGSLVAGLLRRNCDFLQHSITEVHELTCPRCRPYLGARPSRTASTMCDFRKRPRYDHRSFEQIILQNVGHFRNSSSEGMGAPHEGRKRDHPRSTFSSSFFLTSAHGVAVAERRRTRKPASRKGRDVRAPQCLRGSRHSVSNSCNLLFHGPLYSL